MLSRDFAHRKREDNRLSPAEVLGQEKSRLRTPEQLHRIFYATRFLRRLDRLGYAHFRRWKLYGEEGLARHPAVIWLHGDALTVEYEETLLAHLLQTLAEMTQATSHPLLLTHRITCRLRLHQCLQRAF